MTGLRRKLHEAAAVLGGGALGAFVAVVFGCGAFVVFVYGSSDPLHRDGVLLAAARAGPRDRDELPEVVSYPPMEESSKGIEAALVKLTLPHKANGAHADVRRLGVSASWTWN